MRLPWSRRVNSSNQSLFDVRTDERNSRIEIRFIGESEISARAKIYFGQLDNARDSSFQSIFNSTPILYTYICSHWDYSNLLRKTHTIFDWPTLSPFRRFVFWREKGIQEAGGLGKSDTNKKEGGGKKWKVEKRGGGNDCFTMTDTCSRARLITTSLNSYAFYEFPAFFCPDIRTRVFNPHAWITRTCANGTKTNRLAIDESNALH